MKKNIFACICVSALMCSALASCEVEFSTNNSDYSFGTDTEYAAKSEDKPQTRKAEEKPAETPKTTEKENTETTEKPQETAKAQAKTKILEFSKSPSIKSEEKEEKKTSSKHTSDANKLMDALNIIDLVDGGATVDTDSDDVITEGIYSYSRVTDTRFWDIDDVISFVTGHITGDLLYKYNELYVGDVPMFKEFDGKLYYLFGARGCGFNYTGDPVITYEDDSSFTFTVPVDNFGEVQTFTVNAVKEDGKWKASSYSFS
ncbi:hypothetical protein [Ruminococcus flavefaciens]|uniref:Lipoprotein n=1 Tax=Ruminococcus flavefaciens 007c TaxID=1341157 RepID=W7UMY4_RUMFL|nr:hypothetical protein [Ruminococcus flavefaciens]EWM52949.1 hypothetical protein RF007C_15155 [Ruminococcus flavefaciens 007c]